MKNFSQTIVSYHGCGNCYLDGTNKIVPKNRKCIMPRNNLFWKNPIDTSNKIAKSTRTQLKIKAKANRSYIKRYLKFVKTFKENKFDDASFSSDYSTDNESNGYGSDNESISGNATETEQNLTDNELTGENLIIDENTMQTSDIKNNEQTPRNKETNNKILPEVM